MAQQEIDRVKCILGEAHSAFMRLLEYGCNEDLAGLVVLLRTRSPSIRNRKNQVRLLEFRRADQHELILNGVPLRTARSKLRQARNALKKFRAALEPFEGAPVWRYTGDTMVGPYGSRIDSALRTLEQSLDRVSTALDGTGPRAHPSISASIERFIRAVRDQTGQFHDSEVAEVLAAAIGEPVPRGYPRFEGTESLKTWRAERGICDQQERKSKTFKP